MNRKYTIHDYKGLKFINLTGTEIHTNDGESYAPENFKLKARVQMIFGNEPDNVSPAVLYKAKFVEILHLPSPSDLQWLDTLDEEVLVIATPKICNTYNYPVCMFRTKLSPNGIRYSDPNTIVWSLN